MLNHNSLKDGTDFDLAKYDLYWLIGLVDRVFAYGPGDLV